MPTTARRETPGEGSPAVTHVTEAGDHFVVTFADEQSATVVKEGLKPDTLAHIQGMAHGGEIRGIAGGGIRVDSESETGGGIPEDASPRPLAPLPTRPKIGLTPTEDDEPSPREETEPKGYADGGEVDAGPGGFAPLDFMGGADAGMPGAPLQFTPGGAIFPNVDPMAQAASAQVTAGAPVSPDGSLTDALRKAALGASGPLLIGPMGQAIAGPPPPAPPGAIARNMPPEDVPAPAPAPQQQPVQAPGMPTWGGSGALGELNKGLAEQRAGLAMQVEAEKARDAALMSLQDRHIADMQAMEAQHAEKREALQRRADDLFQATLNAKIDPNRVWANADMSQRIGAGIGILLSGIGVGLAGGPNLALQQIDRTIDRDLDAQKANLETQKGLLSFYLQQGRDMLSAQALAKADLKDMLAAQISRVSAEFGGQEAAARAQMVGGQLRTDAAGKRQEIMARDFQMQSQRMAMGLEMERNRLISQFASARPGTPGAEQMWELVPKETRERRVRLPGGGWGLAKDANQATDLQKGFDKIDEFKQLLGQYRTILDKGSPRLWTGFGGDETAAQSLRAQLQAAIKEAEALGALSKGDYDFIDRQIPDISAIFTGKESKGQGLDVLGSVVDARINTRLKTLGLR